MRNSGIFPFSSIPNFRDLASQSPLDGPENDQSRTTPVLKTGVLYRSGNLKKLSRSDRKALGALPLKSVADFRSDYETIREPDKLIPGAIFRSYPMESGGPDVRDQVIRFLRGKEDMDFEGFMEAMNRDFVITYSKDFGLWLRDLADGRLPLPSLFHCTAGKDRTGFAAAILMTVLGFPWDDVLREYLRSSIFIQQMFNKLDRRVKIYSRFRRSGKELLPLLDVRSEYLEAAFQQIGTTWGSFYDYAQDPQGLGLSSDQILALKSMLLV
jgi:protein-tyrosine phosphatase